MFVQFFAPRAHHLSSASPVERTNLERIAPRTHGPSCASPLMRIFRRAHHPSCRRSSCGTCRTCSDMLGHAQTCSAVLGHERTCSGMLGHARTCSDMFGGARTCSDMLGHARACSDMLGHARACLVLRASARSVLNAPPVPCRPTSVAIAPCSIAPRLATSKNGPTRARLCRNRGASTTTMKRWYATRSAKCGRITTSSQTTSARTTKARGEMRSKGAMRSRSDALDGAMRSRGDALEGDTLDERCARK